MNQTLDLVCIHPGPDAELILRKGSIERLKSSEVLVRVLATSVNPIDVKRARGYGKRLLGALGAAGSEVILGNDFAGEVMECGNAVEELKPGDRVYGVVPTSRSGGAHRDILAVESELVRLVPAEVDFGSVAVLPYTFCTLWKAIQGLKIRPDAISGKRILIVGASGALGQMATQLLSSWGASITALCSEPHMELCRSLGASEVVDRFAHSIAELPSDYDVTLNFGSWAHEVPLLERLKRGAIGHATTLHPLLSQLDEHGWISGGWGARRQWSKMHGLLQSRSPDALYRWTVFRPDTSALDVLAELVNRQAMHLKVGMTVPFIDAKVAFDHVDFGNPTRAILFPGHRSPS